MCTTNNNRYGGGRGEYVKKSERDGEEEDGEEAEGLLSDYYGESVDSVKEELGSEPYYHILECLGVFMMDKNRTRIPPELIDAADTRRSAFSTVENNYRTYRTLILPEFLVENFEWLENIKDPMIKTTATRWFEEPPYDAVKLPVNLENKTAVKGYHYHRMYNAIFGPKYGYLDGYLKTTNVKDRSAYSEDDEKMEKVAAIEHVVVDSIRAGKAAIKELCEIVARGDKIKILPLQGVSLRTSNIPPVVMKEFKRNFSIITGQEGQLKSDPELEVNAMKNEFKFDSFALTTKAKHCHLMASMSANIGVAKERLFLYGREATRVSDAMIYIATQHLHTDSTMMTAQWWAQWYTGQHYLPINIARMPDVVRRVGVVSDLQKTIGKYACLIRNILTTKNKAEPWDKQEKYKELIRSAVSDIVPLGKSFSDVKLKDENTRDAAERSIDGDMQIIISQFRIMRGFIGALIAEEMEDEITDLRAAFVYMGDFYHLAKYNDEFRNDEGLEFIRHYVGNCSPLVHYPTVDEVMEVVMYSAEFYLSIGTLTNFAEFKKCMELYNQRLLGGNRHYDTPSRVIDHLPHSVLTSTCRTATSFGNAGNVNNGMSGAFSSPYTVIFNQSSAGNEVLRINKKNEQNAVKTFTAENVRKRAVVKKEMYAAGAAPSLTFYLPEHVKRSKLAE
ncbi:hypothetical protein SPFM9_00285 [Salmonella phage SPFM9]|nr:hypothetical protein SPFM9_00285 [Salmonella phage SPFM9]